MNTLYKYCDRAGIVNILGLLELKLPYVAEVNDPFECLPIFDCKNDLSAIKARCLLAFKRKNVDPLSNFDEKVKEEFGKGDIQKKLKQISRENQNEWNQKRSCLISVSKTAQNTVMWAHYAEKHKGAVIGIDFDIILQRRNSPYGIVMDPVSYSKNRPRIDILVDPDSKIWGDQFIKLLLTKSDNWSYEKEYRTVFLDHSLEEFRKQGLASVKDFDGKKTWFLRLNPLSIKEIVFGLYMEDDIKIAIRKSLKRPELQHVKLYQAMESETYILNLIDLS